jgi:hypothetical protein
MSGFFLAKALRPQRILVLLICKFVNVKLQISGLGLTKPSITANQGVTV